MTNKYNIYKYIYYEGKYNLDTSNGCFNFIYSFNNTNTSITIIIRIDKIKK